MTSRSARQPSDASAAGRKSTAAKSGAAKAGVAKSSTGKSGAARSGASRGTSSASRSRTAADVGAHRPRAGTDDMPLYRQLYRVEAKLWPDQATELTALRRKIMDERTERGGERITDNTLIRVAIDLLLAHSDRLAGHTEDELRASVLGES